MKKIVLMLAFCLGVSIANAQISGVYIENGAVLNGYQWHYDNLSIIDAGNSNYLVITPTEYYYSSLSNLNIPSVNSFIKDVTLSYQPYVKFGYLGWFIHARYGDYFLYYAEYAWHAVKVTAPVYYNYYYNLCGVRYIDLRCWHFVAHPAPRHHHHHATPPPSGHHHGATPPPPSGHHHGNTPPPHSNRGGYVPSSQRGSGSTARPTNPPSNGNGSVRPSNPSSGGNRSGSIRPSRSSSGGSRPGSSRSSGVSAPRPTSHGQGSTPSRSSEASTRRR